MKIQQLQKIVLNKSSCQHLFLIVPNDVRALWQCSTFFSPLRAPRAVNLSTLREDAGDVTTALFLFPGLGDDNLWILSPMHHVVPTSSFALMSQFQIKNKNFKDAAAGVKTLNLRAPEKSSRNIRMLPLFKILLNSSNFFFKCISVPKVNYWSFCSLIIGISISPESCQSILLEDYVRPE